MQPLPQEVSLEQFIILVLMFSPSTLSITTINPIRFLPSVLDQPQMEQAQKAFLVLIFTTQ
jgi:hypothetical protein